MSGTFVQSTDIVRETLDWGQIGWISRPTSTGSKQLTVMDVWLEPGFGHAFHKHPDQEEVILVREGQIEQWIEERSQLLGPGEAVFLPKGLVHASYNTGSVTAKLTVTLGPCVGDGGYESVEVADQEPWVSLK